MLQKETEFLKKVSEQKDTLLIEQQEQLAAYEQQLQAAVTRLARQQQHEVAAAGRDAVQGQEQQQGKAAAAAHIQHTQQEESPPEQQQHASGHAGNAAQACTAAAPEQPAVEPMGQADSPLYLEAAADQSDGERLQEAGQSDDKEVHEVEAAPERLVPISAGLIARQARAEAVAAHSPSAERPVSGVSAAAGHTEDAEPSSADGKPAAAYRPQPVAQFGQVKSCFCRGSG